MIGVDDGLFSQEVALPLLHNLHNHIELCIIQGVIKYCSMKQL
jgi:hypothetical protein